MSNTPEPNGSGPTPGVQPAARRNDSDSSPSEPDHSQPDPQLSGSQPESNEQFDSSDGGPAKRRRRGSRGGRGRNAAARAARAASGDVVSGEVEVDSDSPSERNDTSPIPEPQMSPTEIDPAPRPVARTSRTPRVIGAAKDSVDNKEAAPGPTSSRPFTDAVAAKAVVGAKPNIGDSRASHDDSEHDNDDSRNDDSRSDDSPAKRRRKRGGRRRSGAKKPVESGALAIEVDDDEVIELDEETLEKRRGRERKGRPVGRYFMCVQVREGATQIAVMEGRNLIEHYVSRPHDDALQIDGNIYLSRVQNVLPGMEAAFIDIGTPKNAVLYRGDVRYDSDDIEGAGAKPSDSARIEQMIKTGQNLVCQVTKNPIGAKGARLTQEVSLPGRFVVLMPNNSTYGISKRLPDDERKRLRKVLDQVKPAQHGIIVRTAAEGVTEDELRRDVQRLLRQWDEIEKKTAASHAPALLYREPDMAVRLIREEFNRNYRGVIIDSLELFEEVRDYVASISPELADRIEYYNRDTEPLPLFERYHVHEQVHKALDRKVWLPSGGSLIIERTEALTVIDVNTGKNVGKSNLEETVYRNNLEAADEIAHQLRLRDIGGIIVIDFIDMEIKKNRDEVLNTLRDALARDKTRTQAYPIGELGLVEMTRKRISEGLVESFSEPCPSCSGRGFVIDESLMDD